PLRRHLVVASPPGLHDRLGLRDRHDDAATQLALVARRAWDGRAVVGRHRQALAGSGAAVEACARAPRRSPSPRAQVWSGATCARAGHLCHAAITTRTVPMPPPTTDTIGPNSAAVAPLSKPPSSFEKLMKSEFTLATRPRSRSGVNDCISVCRTTM